MCRFISYQIIGYHTTDSLWPYIRPHHIPRGPHLALWLVIGCEARSLQLSFYRSTGPFHTISGNIIIVFFYFFPLLRNKIITIILRLSSFTSVNIIIIFFFFFFFYILCFAQQKYRHFVCQLSLHDIAYHSTTQHIISFHDTAFQDTAFHDTSFHSIPRYIITPLYKHRTLPPYPFKSTGPCFLTPLQAQDPASLPL